MLLNHVWFHKLRLLFRCFLHVLNILIIFKKSLSSDLLRLYQWFHLFKIIIDWILIFIVQKTNQIKILVRQLI